MAPRRGRFTRVYDGRRDSRDVDHLVGVRVCLVHGVSLELRGGRVGLFWSPHLVWRDEVTCPRLGVATLSVAGAAGGVRLLIVRGR